MIMVLQNVGKVLGFSRLSKHVDVKYRNITECCMKHVEPGLFAKKIILCSLLLKCVNITEVSVKLAPKRH
jgi:hypothetical protein